MEEVRGEGRRSYITGSSTHNTRIECLWRDVYCAVTYKFVDIFSLFESSGHLNPLNKADLLCLHYLYIPRVNAMLSIFQRAWNSHPLSSEGNYTPLQLFAGHAISDPDFEATVPDDYDLIQKSYNQSQKSQKLYLSLIRTFHSVTTV